MNHSINWGHETEWGHEEFSSVFFFMDNQLSIDFLYILGKHVNMNVMTVSVAETLRVKCTPLNIVAGDFSVSGGHDFFVRPVKFCYFY